MQLRLLHLDDALLHQERFLAACGEFGAHHIEARFEGAGIRLWSRDDGMNRLRRKLSEEMQEAPGGASLTWFGSGDFHHVTAALVEMAAGRLAEAVTIVHFDNHPDWVRHRRTLHCGSWASHVLRAGTAARVVSLGVGSADLTFPEVKGADLQLIAAGRQVVFPLGRASTAVARSYGDGPAHRSRGHRIHWRQFTEEPEGEAVAEVLASIDTEAVYITIDKDVLAEDDARTNWDQGRLSISHLVAWLAIIARSHRVVGVDVSGDISRPSYGGTLLDACLKRCEALIGQGPARPDEDDVRINETSNLKLLASMVELLC